MRSKSEAFRDASAASSIAVAGSGWEVVPSRHNKAAAALYSNLHRQFMRQCINEEQVVFCGNMPWLAWAAK